MRKKVHVEYFWKYWKFHYPIRAVCWLDVEFEREKFYPGPGLEPGPLAFHANALTSWAIQDKYESTIELISYVNVFLSNLRVNKLCFIVNGPLL